MGKNTKPKQKKKKLVDKKKEVSTKNKNVVKKLEKLTDTAGTLKSQQKESNKQWKALQKQYTTLSTEYEGTKTEATNLLQQISHMQSENQSTNHRLASEIAEAVQIRERLDNLELREQPNQEQSNALKQQLEQQVSLVEETRSRLNTVEQFSNQGERLREQIDYLQAGKSKLEQRIGSLITEVSGLQSSSSNLDAGTKNLSTRLDDTIKRLEESSAQNQLMTASIDSLKQTDLTLSLRMDQQHEWTQKFEEQVGKLDRAAQSIAAVCQSMQKQIGQLKGSLTTAEARLLENDAELEKKSQHLDSKYKHLAVKQSRLTGGVLVAGVLLLLLGGMVYGIKFARLEHETAASSQQIKQISQQIKQQEGRQVDRQQTFSASTEKDSQESMAEQWNSRFEQVSQNQAAMETSLKGFTEQQNEIESQLEWLIEELDKADSQQVKTHNLLEEMATKQAEGQTVAEQQRKQLRLIEAQLQDNQVETKSADDPASNRNVRSDDWLQGLNPKHYTIQIFAAYDVAVASRVAARDDLHEPMAIYKGEFNQKDWYVLVYGDFSSLKKARLAIQDLPEDIRSYGPWVRNLSTVQNQLPDQQ